MPQRPRRPCSYPGCGVLCDLGRCDRHRKQAQRELDQRRGSRHERGYDSRWVKARAAYLRLHPLCRAHERRGQVAAATEVDHIVPHRGDRVLFWDSDNWQPLCKPCHSAKTASEDGAFGNPGGGSNL